MAIPEPTTATEVHLVTIASIKVAPWNPKDRISERRLTQLRISIDDLGLFYPVLIDDKKNLVDGHRRLAIAKAFGWRRIPAITVPNGHEYAYGSVQLTQQKLTGQDRIAVYLVNADALLLSQRQKIAIVEKTLGRWAVELLAKHGMTDAAFRTSKAIIRIMTKADIELTLEVVFRWVVKHKLGTAHILLLGGYPPKDMAAKIKADKPIRIE